ncbi:unnamed protein product [Brassica rapa]|uniref:Uncharacterized protein n=1 Tax=Brassica campestris TaxID=3711 RepID=A0A8D9HP17_BRACM|nr:unnamed protein product [Brassica rapa]
MLLVRLSDFVKFTLSASLKTIKERYARKTIMNQRKNWKLVPVNENAQRKRKPYPAGEMSYFEC